MTRILYPARTPETKRQADWRDDGLCRSENENPEDWFPVGAGVEAQAQERHAKAVCWMCPSMQACGQWALDTGQEHGVWGGLSEAERRTLRRRAARPISIDDYTGAHPGRTTALTFTEAWEKYARPNGEHIIWTGATKAIKHGDRVLTPNQLGFYQGRGHWPVGMVKRTCTVRGCVLGAHLQDGEDRGEEADQTARKARGPAECGTNSGYRKHMKEKTPTCEPCRRAHTDADALLRRTGTSKVAV